MEEVLLAIHLKRHTWREDAPVSPWLYAIAPYKAVDAWRRRPSAEAPLDRYAETLAAPEFDVTAPRDAARLLSRLDARSARIVREIGIEGRTAAETGTQLQMTENAVRVAFHRAVNRLADLVRRAAE